MTIREMLDQELSTNEDGDYTVRPEYLATIIDEGLRAAYAAGYRADDNFDDDGVTAGVAAMISNS